MKNGGHMSLAEEINKLPPDLQQQVADFVGYLHEKNKRKPQVDAQRQWRELAGIAAFPLTPEEDAQTWITSQRQADQRNDALIK